MFGWTAMKNGIQIFDTSNIFLDIAHFRQSVKNFHLFRALHNIWSRKSSNIICISNGFHINNIQNEIQKELWRYDQ